MKKCDCLHGSDNYLDVYFSRVTHYGDNVAEVAQNAGAISFNKWLSESPNAVDLRVEDSFHFKGIIFANKQDENKLTKQLCVANNVPLKIGHVVVWDDERWITYQKERKVRETYQTFFMVRCNYIIKWIDALGHLKKSWCHFVSSLDSKIKENFRTWNNTITPQPNKYAEIILPRTEISKYTKFIVEDEGWYIVEYDYTSVPGVMYLSLTEDKVNMIYDDLKEDIADTDKRAVYEFIVPEQIQKFQINEIVSPIFTITKNGIPVQMETVLTLPNRLNIKYNENREMIAIKEGIVDISIALKDFPQEGYGTIKVEIVSDNLELVGYIAGKDTLKLDRATSFELIVNEDIEDEIDFYLEETNLAFLTPSKEKNKINLKANNKNLLGSVTLHAKYKEKDFSKEIQIIPLW